MSDKDFTKRDTFAGCFPDAKLNICLHHTLRTFRREVTTDKMRITSAKRHQCLEIIKSIVYSKSPSEYESNVTLLKNTKLKSVVNYFMESWHPIREQWEKTFKDATFSLGETTNNRLQSTFNKIKNVCSKYASLLQFFTEFFSVINSLRIEHSHQCLMALS